MSINPLESTITDLNTPTQLFTIRFNRLLSNVKLTLPQYVLLSYLSKQSDAQSLTQITNALHANQPAITKTAQHLLAKGYIRVQQGIEDKRIRHISLSAVGKKAFRKAECIYQIEAQAIFADWKVKEVASLKRQLDQIVASVSEG